MKDLLKVELKARCPLIAIDCYEPEKTGRSISANSFINKKWNVWWWSLAFGIEPMKKDMTPLPPDGFEGDFSGCIQWISAEEDNILFTSDWWAIHKEDQNAISTVARLFGEFGPAKENGSALVILGPQVHQEIPKSLENFFTCITTGLPDVDDQVKILNKITTGTKGKIQKHTEREIKTIAQETIGLTTYQLENIASRSIAKDKKLNIEFIRDQTEHKINNIGPLKVVHPDISPNDVGGLTHAIEYAGLLTSEDLPEHLTAKMLLFLGPPGCGKSMTAYAISQMKGWKCVEFNIGAAMSKYVGESEQKMRETLDYLSTASRIVVVMDEIEKSFAGAGSDSSGVTTRLLGEFLTWNQNRTNRVLIVATANAIENLPSELFRAGRVDKMYYVDIPSVKQCQKILDLKLKKFSIEETPDVKWFNNWTGAELEQLCLEYARFDFVKQRKSFGELKKGITPIIKKLGTRLDALRKFAELNCVDANTGETYIFKKAVEPPNALYDAQKLTPPPIPSSP